MRKLIFLLLAITSASAHAEVYKCTEKHGKIVYQNNPCNAAAKEQQLDLKPEDPAKEAEARAKLEAIRNEYDARKAAELNNEKELTTQRKEAAALEFAHRNAAAQQEQAEAQQRQAEALETQNQRLNQPVYIVPPTFPAPTTSVPGQQPLQPGSTIH